MSLKEYRKKRDFKATPEPSEAAARRSKGLRRFVIQKHAARRLHFDLRLEFRGRMASWAVPKSLPLKQGEKRLAVKVEDHPLSYRHFEGTIPPGQYGAGTVQVWDTGTFKPLTRTPLKDLKGGKLHFILHGKKLSGEWYLVRMREEDQWLIIRAGSDHRKLTPAEAETSALSGRTMEAIASNLSSERESAPADPAHLSPAEVHFIEPMKARLMESPPAGNWLYELKFDGFRALAYKLAAAVGLISRTENDLTPKFPEIATALSTIRAEQCVIDGEIVALDPKGRSSFQLLQRYELGEVRPAICYYAFDLLALNGESLAHWPLEKRKAKLKALLPKRGEAHELIRYSASLGGDAPRLLRKVSALHLEGLIGKRAGSLYEPGRRSGAWIKLKLLQEQEFVIGGYTDPTGSRPGFGAILVGYFEDGKLLYAGKVGTGFTHSGLKDLHRRFEKLTRQRCPFRNLPHERGGRYGEGMTAAVMKRCHWLKPTLVAQIRFTEWTRDGSLRHPVFLGLRTDKPAQSVTRESPA